MMKRNVHAYISTLSCRTLHTKFQIIALSRCSIFDTVSREKNIFYSCCFNLQFFMVKFLASYWYSNFHDFSATFQAWKFYIFNSMTFQGLHKVWLKICFQRARNSPACCRSKKSCVRSQWCRCTFNSSTKSMSSSLSDLFQFPTGFWTKLNKTINCFSILQAFSRLTLFVQHQENVRSIEICSKPFYRIIH